MFRLIKRVIKKIRLMKYNEYTIENYLRERGHFIGKNNRIYIKYFSSEPYLVRIGNHCTITAGVPANAICTIEEYKEKCIKKWKTLKLHGQRETWEQ